MNRNTESFQPHSIDITSLPQSFGTGRLQNLIITFDNFSQPFTYFSTNAQFPVKCDSFFAIIVLQGEIHVLINLNEVVVHAGQNLLIMPGCIIQGRQSSEDLRFCGMIIETEYMDIMRKNIGIRLDLTHRYYSYHVRDITPDRMENNVQMYKIICSELSCDDYLYKKEVIQRYCEIWVLKGLLLNDKSEDISGPAKPLNRKEQIFHDFLTLLEKFYTQERSISFYADRMCLTPKYLSTIIKEVSGKHGMEWVDEYVTLEAKALLRNSELSVKQVSDQLNFPSQSMFGRFFKKMTGYSPKQYKLL